MDRLTEKLKLAAAVAPRQAAKIEARADRLIAREPEIEARTEQRFAPLEQMLDSAESGMDALDSALRTMSNGPPLEVSNGSENSSQQPGGSGASTEPSQASGAILAQPTA